MSGCGMTLPHEWHRGCPGVEPKSWPPAEVWCSSCEQPTTGTDGQCDDCRAGKPVPPDAITDPWLRRQYRNTVRR